MIERRQRSVLRKPGAQHGRARVSLARRVVVDPPGGGPGQHEAETHPRPKGDQRRQSVGSHKAPDRAREQGRKADARQEKGGHRLLIPGNPQNSRQAALPAVPQTARPTRASGSGRALFNALRLRSKIVRQLPNGALVG